MNGFHARYESRGSQHVLLVLINIPRINLPIRRGRGALLFARPTGEEVELAAAVPIAGQPVQKAKPLVRFTSIAKVGRHSEQEGAYSVSKRAIRCK